MIAVCTLWAGGERAYDMDGFGRARENWLRTFLPAQRHREPRHLQPAVPRAGPGGLRSFGRVEATREIARKVSEPV